MAQSLARLWTHLIFSTKERQPFLSDTVVRKDMHGYLATVLRNHDCLTLEVGGCDDHVHALFALSRNHSIAQIVKEIKRTSSAWIKTIERRYLKFHWQKGYGAFSVSQSHVANVRNYILYQEQHHRRKTFQDEFRAFLKKYEIEYDERYVWDWTFSRSRTPKALVSFSPGQRPGLEEQKKRVINSEGVRQTMDAINRSF